MSAKPPHTKRQTIRAWLESHLLPVSVVLLAWALCLYQLEAKSLWFDEMGTLFGSGWGGSWLDAIRRPLTIPITPKPPLSFVLTRVFLMLGDRVFFLRLPSAVLATLTVPLVYALGRALFNRQAGLLGALLLAFAPLQIRYAQEARMYAALMFLCTLSFYLFWRALQSRAARWWVAFAAAAVAALHTHLFALLPLATMVLFAVWRLILTQMHAPRAFRARHLVAALAIILVAYSPLLPFLFKGLVGPEGLGGSAAPRWTMVHLGATLRLFGAGSNLGAALYALLAVLGLVRMARMGHGATLLVILWLVLPLVLVPGLPFGHQTYVRYFLPALPVYLLVIALGLQGAAGWSLARLSRSRAWAGVRPSVTGIGLGVLAAALVAITIPCLAAYYVEPKQNWRDATWLVQDLAKPGDKVFVRHPYHQAGIQFYAKQRQQGLDLGQEAPILLLPRDPAAPFPLGDDERAWLVVPLREGFLPGSEFDASILTRHRLLPPTEFRATGKPFDWRLIAPTAYRTVAVVPVVPSPLPTIRFWADSELIGAGECTWLRWEVDNVQELYLDGEGVVGHDARQVCPAVTTGYELEAVLEDGSRLPTSLEIRVATP